MKRVFVSAVLSAALLTATVPLMAQNATTGGQGGNTTMGPGAGKGMHGRHGQGNQLQMMAKKLNLTQQQQDQLKPIFEQTRQQAQAIKNDSTLTQQQKQEKLKALRENTHSQVQTILTPEQQQQMSQMREQRMERMKGARQQMGQRIAQKLNLTQQQQDQLKPIMDKQREQMQAIRTDSALTQAQKQEKMQALRQDTQTQVNAILTPEQQQQWQQMKENRKQHRRHKGGFGQQPTAPQGA
ncbi:MAG TPA: hypothetical protein VN577_23765 [Terriglobales bacterium]|nr:hypothetical protein [Terriglobales bacterium]